MNYRLRSLLRSEVEGKIVLYRSPYDIETKNENGQLVLEDDSRIRATLPTLKYLIEKQCRIVILTWVGRPDGKIVESLRTDPHAKALSQLLNREVQKVDDCIGNEVLSRIQNLKSGDLLMLENTRFYPSEMIDDDQFAQQLAANGQIVVFDAFPQIHRIHASTTGILRHLPSCAGLYLDEEISHLSNLLVNPQRPFVVVIGGAKISDKIDAINNFLKIADAILVGGGLANVFLKTKGYSIGNSFIEDVFVDQVRKEKKDWVRYAQRILAKKPDKIHLPVDLNLGDSLKNTKKTQSVSIGKTKELVPTKWSALDIGLQTQKEFTKIIGLAKTVFWNGPMGLFEDNRFASGSNSIARAMKEVEGTKIIAGGDTIEAAKLTGSLKNFSFVSLGGGASLELLAGKKLPVLEMLSVNN